MDGILAVVGILPFAYERIPGLYDGPESHKSKLKVTTLLEFLQKKLQQNSNNIGGSLHFARRISLISEAWLKMKDKAYITSRSRNPDF